MKFKSLITIIFIFAISFLFAKTSLADHANAVCETNTPKSGYVCSWTDKGGAGYGGMSWCGGNTASCNYEPDAAVNTPAGVSNGSWNFCNNCSWTLSCVGGYTACNNSTCKQNTAIPQCNGYDNQCNTTPACTGCVGGYALCAARNTSTSSANGSQACVSNPGCPTGQTFDACTATCVGFAGVKLGYDSLSGSSVIQSVNYPSLYIPLGSYPNIGIGTTNPVATLDIIGSLKNNSAVTFSGLGGSGNRLIATDNSGNLYATSSTAFGLDLWKGTKNGNIWNGDAGAGNVGIGTTNPGQKLDIIGGSIRTDNQLISTIAGGTAPLSVLSTTTVPNLSAAYLGYVNVGTSTTTSSNYPSSKLSFTIFALPEFGAESGALTVRGWNDSYSSWQLIGNNTPWSSINELYFRTGSAGSWNAVSKVWHSGNLTNNLATSSIVKWTGSTMGNSGMYTNGSYIGVGTTNAQSLLDVNGELRVSGGGAITLYNGVAGTVVGGISRQNDAQNASIQIGAFGGMGFTTGLAGSTGTPTSATSKLWIDNTGKVGIGTTAPVTSLDVIANNGFRNNYATTLSLLGGGGDHLIAADSNGMLYATGSPALLSLWNGTKNGNIWNGDAGAGNVGIGTTNPTTSLDIRGTNKLIGVGVNQRGNLFIATTDEPDINVGGSIVLGGRYLTGQPNLIPFATIHGKKEAAGGSGNNAGFLAFETANNSVSPYTFERMRITSTGNVGIGTTGPNDKLSVSGNISATGYFYSSSGSDGNRWITNSSGLTNLMGIYGGSINSRANSTISLGYTPAVGTAISPVLTVVDTGNVGIGTSNPTLRLDVASNGLNAPASSGTTNNGLMRVGFGDRTWGGAELNIGIINSGGYPVWFQAQNPTALGTYRYIALNPNGGNVGVGTTAPGTTLDVNGTNGFRNNYATTHSSLGAAGNVIVMADNTGTLYGISSTTLTTPPAVYRGKTVGTYNGNNSGNQGYTYANGLCAPVYAGSHVCSPAEMLNTIAAGGTMPSTDVWIFSGPPGYTASANDCNARTINTQMTGPNKNYGTYWEGTATDPVNTPNGRGLLLTCEYSISLACCK